MVAPVGAWLKTIRYVDTLSRWVGKLVAWIVIPLVLGATYEVFARYVFNAPTIWAYDLSYMLYGGHFMLGAGYALLNKAHIRTDIFYEKWSPRTQGWVDAIAYLFLFFPGMIFFFLSGWDSAYYSWTIREVSDATAWQPPVYPLKMAVPVGAILLMIQGVAELLKSLYAARHGEWP
ncbi:MAG: TRAP transporter small permease subunit [Candidatus Methylomirabilia bacterium]